MERETALSYIEIIRMISTEFSSVDDTELEKWMVLCAPTISRKHFKSDYEQAVALLICHKMKMAGLGDKSIGTISDTVRLSSVTEGGESVSFAANSSASDADGEYRLTSYGLQFVSLRRRHCIPIMIR